MSSGRVKIRGWIAKYRSKCSPIRSTNSCAADSSVKRKCGVLVLEPVLRSDEFEPVASPDLKEVSCLLREFKGVMPARSSRVGSRFGFQRA